MIYRFLSKPEFILPTLLNGELWFSKVEDFNDPFEWCYRYRIDSDRDKAQIKKYVEENNISRSEEEKRTRFAGYIKDPSILEKELNRIFDKFYGQGVCCFTEEDNIRNVLMWSYYADSHKGIALGFEENDIELRHCDHLKDNVAIFRPKVNKVIYDEHKKYINPFEKNRPSHSKTKYMKSIAWEHEKEVRFVSPKAGLHTFERENLREVILGIRISSDLRNAIESALKCEANYQSVIVKACELEEKELQIRIR